MCKENPAFYCPSCATLVPPSAAVPNSSLGQWQCPTCDTVLEPDPFLAGNPISVTLGLKLIGVVARQLVASGAVERLEDKARQTANSIDDIAARVAAAIVREAAKL